MLGKVGSSQFDAYPKGGAYFCIGIKSLNPGKAVEGVDQNHLYYPNKAVVDDWSNRLQRLPKSNRFKMPKRQRLRGLKLQNQGRRRPRPDNSMNSAPAPLKSVFLDQELGRPH